MTAANVERLRKLLADLGSVADGFREGLEGDDQGALYAQACLTVRVGGELLASDAEAYTIVCGDPIDGISLNGLYDTDEKANDAAESFNNETWWVVQIDTGGN